MPKHRPPLQIVDATNTNPVRPPRNLGQHGNDLWTRIQAEYAVTDSGGVEMLAQACEALDCASALYEQIDRDGAVLRIRGVPREHPALKAALAHKSFVVRTLQRLGLNYEPVRSKSGRPTFWEQQT